MNSVDAFHQTAPIDVGIIGGGQLARMMVLKGVQMGLNMHVLSPSKDDPAAQVAPLWLAGSVDSEKSLGQFLKTVEYCTFESEFLNPIQLQRVSRKSKSHFSPTPYLMGLLQDRLTQKDLLDRYQIPSAPYAPVFHMDDLLTFFDRNQNAVVLKQRRFGYDGYGTFVLEKRRELNRVSEILRSNKEGFIVEKKISFSRELAITVARSAKGSMTVFPLVETKQVDARCFWVKGPVTHPLLPGLLQRLKKFLVDIEYVGVMTFELFDLAGKGLLVNEIAPRVHNSVHHSLESTTCDQFSMHLRCILGLPLVEPQLLKPGFAMVNLLGTGKRPGNWRTPGGVFLHWYGKIENRKGRKLGHLTALDANPNLALRRALRAAKEFNL